MNHIVVDFRPFAMNQNVMVYVDGGCVKSVGVGIDRITDVVNGLKKEYNIHQVDLCGSQAYLSKFQNEMKTKFADDECEINIVMREN